MSKELTPREARFVEEYARTRNAAHSARVAGWSVTNAGPAGLRLLRKPAVVAALAAQGVAIVRGANPPGQIRKKRVFVKRGLTLLQQRFVEAYLICANATEAARRAGLPGRKPEFAGAKMMRRPGVAEAIAAEREASAQRTRITADRVRQELARLAFSDIGDIADWDESGMMLRARDDIAPDDRAAIAELKLKQGRDGMRATIRLHSKQAALDALAKHMGLYGRGVKPALAVDATPKRSGNDILRERLLKIAGRKE
jgi:phage terminase small subunit